jgi:hypothetical protein
MRPLNEAATTEASMNEAATLALNEIFSAYSSKEMAGMYTKKFIPEINQSLTKMGRIMVALNWGNEDNQQKLMSGYHWSRAQVQAILDTLDERDWKMIQAIWDHIDSYWPETKAMSLRVTGLAPTKVEALPVDTKYGQFKGGYFPLKYDDRQDNKAYNDLTTEAAKMTLKGAYTRATTRHGHRKERVKNVERPIRLDFGVIFEHVSQVIHDQTHYETLMDLNKIVKDPSFQASVKDHYGDVVYRQITDVINDIAGGTIPAQRAIERAMEWLRQGATISGLGWNLMTSLLQPAGLSQSVVRIGAKWVGVGLKRFLGDAVRMENTAKLVYEKSEFMRLRGKTQMREINEIRNQVRGRNQTMSDIEDSFFWIIGLGQKIADIPTWIGAYEKAVDGGADEKEAIAQADQAVLDSQGGGQIKDLASYQRGGPFFKLWTNFYSYFNTTYNLAAESAGKTDFKSAKSVGRFAGDMLMLYTVPAVAGLILKEAVRGSSGDGEDDWLDKLIREQINQLLGSLLLVREIGSLVSGAQGYQGPAGTRFYSELGRLGVQIKQGELDEAAIRALNSVAGIIFHYPAGQIDKTARGIMAVSKGEAGPMAILVGPPTKNR